MDAVLTETCTHKNNPTGSELATVATGIACTPIDKASSITYQAYPIEKQFLIKQCYTKYTAFEAGDYLVANSITYAVKAVHFWDVQGSMDAYYELILEEQSGS